MKNSDKFLKIFIKYFGNDHNGHCFFYSMESSENIFVNVAFNLNYRINNVNKYHFTSDDAVKSKNSNLNVDFK